MPTAETAGINGWNIAAARAPDGLVRVAMTARKDGAETAIAVDLLPAEARAFARSILAASGDAFERSANHGEGP